MHFSLTNGYAVLKQCNDDEYDWISDYLTFEYPTFFRGKRGVTKKKLFNPMNGSFPAGLLRVVRSTALEEQGFTVTVEDDRVKPCDPDPNADLGWLRPYQLEAVERAVKRTKGILWLPTGAGKTEIAIGLVKKVPTKWLFIVHRSQLAEQAAARYNLRTGKTASTVNEDGDWEGDSTFNVATFQTLWRYHKTDKFRKFMDSVGGIIIDEAHTLPADSFWQVAMAARNAYWRIGLSGTPLARSDHKSTLTVAALGLPMYRVRPAELIKLGVIAKPDIRFIHVPQPEEPHVNRRWAQVYKRYISNSKVRNSKVVDATAVAQKPALVFVSQLKHGRDLLALMHKKGMNAGMVDGAKSTELRNKRIQQLVEGDIDVLICTVVFQEGVDIPDLRSVVVACGGASDIATIQRIGRGMRMAAGKSNFEVWDFMDYGHNWVTKHSRSRARAYIDEGFDVFEGNTISGEFTLHQQRRRRKKLSKLEKLTDFE